MRSFRVTPFAATDFALLESVWGIMFIYLSLWQMILISASILIAIICLIIFFIRARKEKVNFKIAACSIAASALMIFGLSSVYGYTGVLPKNFSNLPDAYRDYGFVYCYTVGIFDRGIDRPDDYSKENIDEILSSIGVSAGVDNQYKPNIIFLQLESFFDVNYLNDITFSENPVKNFTELKKEYTNGFLTVPSIGSGTANTEFEIITGMSLDFFGAAEYPYKTIMQESTCETICYNLKEQGYTSHALHNHSGDFYDRNIVYENFGFDTFTSVEYMQNVKYNPIGWAEDAVLTDEILKALDSTPAQDLVYAITVQAHGRYPEKALEGEEPIDVYGTENEKEHTAYKYFVNQLSKTDEFIGNLISELQTREEFYIVVMFGDHLPSLGIDEEDLTAGNLFQTEYVIWSNYKMEREIKDLDSYQLTAYAMQRAGFSNGIFTKLHQNYSTNENYYNALEMLEYDVLYGDYDAYNGKQKYQPTDIKMGVVDIIVEEVTRQETELFISGHNFTEHSKIILDGRRVDTVFIDSNNLKTDQGVLDETDEMPESIVVAQVTKNGEILSEVEYKP
ncbi:MAG: LTA synthase family protein [Clostridia bacterium]|nr:LTA synthase family protein [Clostridia bacterium]